MTPYTQWPRGEVAGPACPHGAGTDQVTLQDTEHCHVASLWADMCPCRAVLSGADPAWRGFDDDGGDLLPTQKENVG